MVTWLLKRFVPGYEQAQDQQVRMKVGTLGSVVGILINVLLAASKAAVGAIMGSVAVMADAANNLSDAAGSVMALITVRLAQKPVDRDHPYGHGRMEYIGALGVGVLILLMAVELFSSAVESILNPVAPQTSVWMAAVLVIGIAAKLWLWRFYSKLGRMVDSAALLATSKDALSDVMATSAVLISMLVSPYVSWPLDGLMGLVVAALVLRAGVGVCRDMLDSLLGGKPDQQLGRQIIDLLLRKEGILGAHDLMLHDYGPGRCVASVHAEVSADMSIVDAHEIVDEAERDIGEKLNIPICIHMDPIVTGDEETDRVKAQMVAYLKSVDAEYMLHDFRCVPGDQKISLVFDVVVPDGRDTRRLTELLQEHAAELDPHYACVIHYDLDYYHQ